MLIRHTFLYLPAQLLGPGFQFVAAILWTHWLAPDAYGVLAYVMASQELAGVSILWWSQFMLRYIRLYAEPQERARYQRVENAVLLGGAATQFAVVLVSLTILHEAITAPLIVASGVYAIARSLLGHVGERARAEERIGLFTVAQLAAPVFGFALGLLFVQVLGPSPAYAISGLAAANALVLASLWIWMGFGVSIAPIDRAIFRRGLAFGGPLILGAALTWISPNGIRIVVDRVSGPTAVGLVSVGWGIGQRFASVMAMALTAAAFPLAIGHLQAGRREEALKHITLNAVLLFGLLAPATAGLLLLTGDLVRLAVAPAFQEITLAVLPIAACAGALRNFRMHFSDQAFLLFEQSRAAAAVAAVEAVATMVFCWIGATAFGLVGAAWGCFVGAAIGAAFSFSLCILRNGLPIPLADMGRTLLATFVMTAAVRLFPWSALPLGPAGKMGGEALLGALVYALALAALYPRLARDGLRLVARRLAEPARS